MDMIFTFILKILMYVIYIGKCLLESNSTRIKVVSYAKTC